MVASTTDYTCRTYLKEGVNLSGYVKNIKVGRMTDFE